ncbi:unnamed protein product [Closterium sp. NIES-54]
MGMICVFDTLAQPPWHCQHPGPRFSKPVEVTAFSPSPSPFRFPPHNLGASTVSWTETRKRRTGAWNNIHLSASQPSLCSLGRPRNVTHLSASQLTHPPCSPLISSLSPYPLRSPLIFLAFPSFPHSSLFSPRSPHLLALPSSSPLSSHLPCASVIPPSLPSSYHPPFISLPRSKVFFLHAHPHLPLTHSAPPLSPSSPVPRFQTHPSCPSPSHTSTSPLVMPRPPLPPPPPSNLQLPPLPYHRPLISLISYTPLHSSTTQPLKWVNSGVCATLPGLPSPHHFL